MGVIEMTQLVLPLMRESGSGVIVNVSSLGGRMTLPLFSTYHATKFAVEVSLQLILQGFGQTFFGKSTMGLVVETLIGWFGPTTDESWDTRKAD